jgi:rifampicin phosphotransferase
LIDELPSVCSGALDAAAVRALIARRRQQVSWCEAIELPEWFEGTPAAVWADQQPAQQAAPATGETVLRGIPVSPGRVRGRARVITELDDDATVEQGEILVAPFTDAAWTPLFFTAAGVVVDLGGPLSHGSTVAREYGLPAVVNVKDGTRRIRNGQEITVDGAAGEVILHA